MQVRHEIALEKLQFFKRNKYVNEKNRRFTVVNRKLSAFQGKVRNNNTVSGCGGLVVSVPSTTV